MTNQMKKYGGSRNYLFSKSTKFNAPHTYFLILGCGPRVQSRFPTLNYQNNWTFATLIASKYYFLEYEIKRQREILERGDVIEQETRAFDDEHGYEIYSSIVVKFIVIILIHHPDSHYNVRGVKLSKCNVNGPAI